MEPEDAKAFTRRFRKAHPAFYPKGTVFSDDEESDEEDAGKGSETSSSRQSKTPAPRARDPSANPSFSDIIAQDIEAAVSKRSEPRPERTLDARFISGSLQSLAYQFNMSR